MMLPDNNKRYFYLHDRLGSVRLVVDDTGAAQNSYTYNAFGESFPTECNEAVSNPFKFSGQFFDDEIGQYHLRARQYDPYISRFTNRDAADGKFEEPLSLHKYLYCQNEPISRIDPMGLWYEQIHRSFGKYGWGNDANRGVAPFDYARLDYDKPATNLLHPDWLLLHFKSKKDAYSDILRAIAIGNTRKFEYAVHEWQDTYTHSDREFHWGHGSDPSIDDVDWSDPDDVAAYRACDATTRMFEDMWFKNNIDDWLEDPLVELPTTNPWLSTAGTWAE
jgi:RHS repeat-associated protein